MSLTRTAHAGLAALLLALSASGCGGGGDGTRAPVGGGDGGAVAASGGGNRRACMDYVAAVNELSCVTAATRFDAAMLCPVSLDSAGCDVSAYYDCLSTAYSCTTIGGVSTIDASGAASCTMVTCR